MADGGLPVAPEKSLWQKVLIVTDITAKASIAVKFAAPENVLVKHTIVQPDGLNPKKKRLC